MSSDTMAGCRKFVYNLAFVVTLFATADFVQLTFASGKVSLKQ